MVFCCVGEVVFSVEEVVFSAEKVTFSAEKVTFSPLKVSFRVEFSREFRAKVALFLLYVSSGSRKDRLYDV